MLIRILRIEIVIIEKLLSSFTIIDYYNNISEAFSLGMKVTSLILIYLISHAIIIIETSSVQIHSIEFLKIPRP